MRQLSIREKQHRAALEAQRYSTVPAHNALVEPEILLLIIAFALLVAWEIRRCFSHE